MGEEVHSQQDNPVGQTPDEAQPPRPQQQHAADTCCPNRGLYRVGSGAQEGHDLQLLLARSEEPLDPPAVLVDRSDRVGGGSSIDLAKGVALRATHTGTLASYALIEGGMTRITSACAPVIAIPTTAGIGSEVGRGAILIVNDGRKVGSISPHLVPKTAICDPELTLGLPALLTAATGMATVAHCIETSLSPAFNTHADGIALEDLARGWRQLERAVANPNDRESRLNMMSASMQGAMAFQKGLVACTA